MTLRIYDELPFDSEVFKEINTHLTLNKGKYYGTISCSDDYLKSYALPITLTSYRGKGMCQFPS